MVSRTIYTYKAFVFILDGAISQLKKNVIKWDIMQKKKILLCFIFMKILLNLSSIKSASRKL